VHSLSALDLHWAGRPRSIASALLRSEDSVALVDPGPASTISTLREQLHLHGLEISDVDSILLTHIHLDHAGATGTLIRENPRLAVYVHARGIPHLADPAKLLRSASRLYGDDMTSLFGEFLPVPDSNLRSLQGGETITLGSRELQVLYTPGHASHHVTYFDPAESVAFVGDTAGICINGHRYMLAATPPPDISIELWDASLDAILRLGPKRLFLTHFSFSDRPRAHILNYRECLYRWRDLSARLLSENLEESTAIHRFAQQIAADAAQFLSPDEISLHLFNGALNLSWLGLARYHRKRAEAAVEDQSPAKSVRNSGPGGSHRRFV
jgi:glyoxylase-like metal-dependent hydrolase (beta-lactamase superfamily II)